ncbi:MAG: biopolymer transporter ExbD [Planctomycetaceae bacterium]|nr:biopolymer transporter ExbD [Planctomycetaceae bacterium]HAA71801.1 biopolymer transporter ExbD [Planctomycetaceae bacterium]
MCSQDDPRHGYLVRHTTCKMIGNMKLPPTTTDTEGPNLTPVIDVVFLLLIFFLVATQFNQEERELEVELPEVVQAQPVAMTQGLIINITQDGTYKVVRREYNEDQLSLVINQAKKNNPHQTALIRGDGNSALKYAARVMSLCNRAGMDYRIATLESR